MPAQAAIREPSTRARILVALASALFVLLTPLAVIEVRSEPGSEVRIVSSGERLSAEIVDGAQRILVINEHRPADARSVLGDLGRPWERRAAIVIAPGSEGAAAGLWEAIQFLKPQQVFVVGVPGTDQTWSSIEQHARDHGTDLTFLSEDMVLMLGKLTLLLHPPSASGGSAVIVRRDDFNLTFALEGEIPAIESQVIATSGAPPESTSAALIVTGGSEPSPRAHDSIQIDASERVVVHLGERLRIAGGTFIPASK